MSFCRGGLIIKHICIRDCVEFTRVNALQMFLSRGNGASDQGAQFHLYPLLGGDLLFKFKQPTQSGIRILVQDSSTKKLQAKTGGTSQVGSLDRWETCCPTHLDIGHDSPTKFAENERMSWKLADAESTAAPWNENSKVDAAAMWRKITTVNGVGK
ncbi:hypothetical protein B0H19DRAFT_1234893 [Mycena capillaripes]|nr:hypothetical protein B0H19DRAFT_1234893 [Mycena capillaripes]